MAPNSKRESSFQVWLSICLVSAFLIQESTSIIRSEPFEINQNLFGGNLLGFLKFSSFLSSVALFIKINHQDRLQPEHEKPRGSFLSINARLLGVGFGLLVGRWRC